MPPVIVKPLRRVSGPSLLAQVTTLPPRPEPSMIVAATTAGSVGFVLRNVIAFPEKSISSL